MRGPLKTTRILRDDLLSLAALLAGWVLFHYRILFLGHTEVLLDSSRFFYPLWKWGAGVWRQGLIPLWNPDAACGTPYLADPQMAAWYPPLVLSYLFLAPTTAFNFLILGHHLWALVGFYLLARNRGFSPTVSLGGCLVFGFSFNTVTLAWITSILLTSSWIPWVFLASDRLWQGKRGSVLLLASTLALQMAAGYPMLAYLTFLTLGIEWVLRGMDKKPVAKDFSTLRKIVSAIMGLALAVAYNAAWLLPLKEMVPYSNLSQRVAMPQGIAWRDLVTWF